MNAPAQGSRSVVPFVFAGCGVLVVLVACLATASAGLIAFGRSRGAGNAAPAPGPGPGPTPVAGAIHVVAVVDAVNGALPIPIGATCEFDVILPSAQTQLCNAQVACGGALLYGGPGAGFFPCAVAPPHVSGADSQTSSADRDGAMQIDTARGILAVQDDALGPRGAFALNARVTGVR